MRTRWSARSPSPAHKVPQLYGASVRANAGIKHWPLVHAPWALVSVRDKIERIVEGVVVAYDIDSEKKVNLNESDIKSKE